jgi:hypothetical protein
MLSEEGTDKTVTVCKNRDSSAIQNNLPTSELFLPTFTSLLQQ